ncbi:MAG TPA: S-adenosylmethionine:tRNA ribosyltransferase-isomerase [Steroidobacteraceae bacterium]|nr:S-adenosylmethionine:tRNA ribosyltransferase-isomerase [Steroidobacteraceae bacterium]
MIAADKPVQRAAAAKLLHVDAAGRIRSVPRSALIGLLRPGDVVVANDAATLPASLRGVHSQTGAQVEVRLAGRAALDAGDVLRFHAVVFGPGDHRTRTEDRLPPPPLAPGQRIRLGPLVAIIEELLGHPRLVALRFENSAAEVWSGLARHGRPVQYAHMQQELQLWDVWTPIAALPVAYEPPSAGFALDWQLLAAFESRRIEFATLTHAAGISSTGDAELDRRLPLDEPYHIPAATEHALRRACREDRRVVAIGTTVVRALEHAAAARGAVVAGDGLADQRIGAQTRLRVVDAILSGTHEPGTSHYELLHAFARESVLRRADRELDAGGFRTHEFGDSVLIERASENYSSEVRRCGAGDVAAAKSRTGREAGSPYTSRFLRAAHVVQESGRLSPAGRLVGCGC